MPISADILNRRTSRFVLWSPREQASAPKLVIGKLVPGNPPTYKSLGEFPLTPVAGVAGLWDVSPAACGLQPDTVYHYWFEVDDSRSTNQPPARIRVTDPFSFCVDWRLYPPGSTQNTQPASVVKLESGVLVGCDPSGDTAVIDSEPPLDKLAPNNQLVIYELPTAWTMSRALNQPERAVATFLDVAALVDTNIGGANFSELNLLSPGKAYLADLGINAIELLPPADSFFKREWGYGTAHYLAPDYELGYPSGNLSPTPNRDLATLVRSCHGQGIRLIADMVMAFGHEEPYNHIDAPDFCIDNPENAKDDPDAWTSTRGGGTKELRNGFGSTLWRYAKPVETYDPMSGQVKAISPASQLMLVQLFRWMRDFHLDGIRIDSVENVANWDFLAAFRKLARDLWNERWPAQQANGEAEKRFLVVGEELSLQFELLRQTPRRIDGLWNERFQSLIRAAILGENGGEPSFEWTVRKAIDCRLVGFADGADAVNYITKHDVEGERHERLFTMLRGFPNEQIEKRIKLAFACLLTAVGIPQILAGEEFADRHDLLDEHGHVTEGSGKQIDPVNYSRLGDDWRRRVTEYVGRLVHLRTRCDALAVNDVEMIHVDLDGKQVVAWRRGVPGSDTVVVVVANFSDFTTPDGPGAEYVVPHWPTTPAGCQWREAGQDRPVPEEWVGREPLFSWEAKVYVTVRA
jgi:pullulanase